MHVAESDPLTDHPGKHIIEATLQRQRVPDPLIAVGLVVGGVADASMQREVPAWLLGALVPISAWSTYFLVLELQNGVGWSPELWAGATLMAGLIGGLVGSLATGVTTPEPRIAVHRA